MNRKLGTAVAASAVALSLSGCSLLGGENPKTGAAAQQNAGAATASAPPQGGKVIATKDGTMDQIPYRVDITGLKRQGKLAMLTFTITNEVESDDPLNIWEVVKGGEADGLAQWTVGNVTLVDPANAKRYRYARFGPQDDHRCACSHFSSGGSIQSRTSHTFYVYYTAPPPQVTKINVDFPSTGVLTDVPIS